MNIVIIHQQTIQIGLKGGKRETEKTQRKGQPLYKGQKACPELGLCSEVSL